MHAVPVLFVLLSDKKKRSCQNIFECIRDLWTLRDLDLSATSSVSDFENNIRRTFEEKFPNILIKKCYFHFAKAIRSRVKKKWFAKIQFKKRDEPKFGSFVRLLIGVPLFKIEYILKGVKNKRKVFSQLKNIRIVSSQHKYIRKVSSQHKYIRKVCSQHKYIRIDN